ERAAQEEVARLAHAQGIPPDRLVRVTPRRPRCEPRARPGARGEQLPQVRRVERRGPGLHAGHAVLDAIDRRWPFVQALPHADQSALRLPDSAPLPRPRGRRPVHDAWPLQRQPGQVALSERGLREPAPVGVQGFAAGLSVVLAAELAVAVALPRVTIPWSMR